MDNQDVIFTKQNGIATLTLNRPDKMNALTPGIVDGIYEATEETVKDDEIRVLVITGTGRAFCAGADVKGGGGPRAESVVKGISKMDYMGVPMQKCSKPIIASINGIAVGGGLDLALSCDFRIASDTAQMAMVYIRRGIIPAQGGTYFLPRLVGIDKACMLIMTGDMIDAREAERIGLITKCVPHEELESATLELAEKLAKNAPIAIARAKRAIYDGLDMDLESTLKFIHLGQQIPGQREESKEGFSAFREKREPFFKGKPAGEN
jgi:enoyl-CoA hydratase/carnithine racemase